MSEYIVTMEHISKSFPGVKALEDVSLFLKPGQVHALMGENGAGKSTLMKCLHGLYSKDQGVITLNDQRVDFQSAKEALDAGIAMIHQELQPIPMMSVAENIFLGRYPLTRFGWIDDQKMHEDTQVLLDEIGLKIDPKALLGTLTVSQMQSVEIAKALSQHASVIIMDEPTSSLTGSEVEILFSMIETLKQRDVAVVYISHKMDEILRISDEVTIMRDGQTVGTWPAASLTVDTIIQQMVGRSLTHMYPPKTNTVHDEVVLRVENLTSSNPLSFKECYFELKRGEILGVGGLVGAQRTELMEALFGLRTIRQGTVDVFGKPVIIKDPKDAIQQGLALVTEDRRSSGIFGVLSVEDNITITSLNKYKKFGLLDRQMMSDLVAGSIDQLNIKTPSKNTKIQNLSGGNQQKVILSRWLANLPEILILDEPTRGIDVGAKYEIYDIMNTLAAQGKSLIVITSEMSELLGVSDRIMVMCEGRVSGFLSREEASQEAVMTLATKFMEKVN